jgi:hypothetical protein
MGFFSSFEVLLSQAAAFARKARTRVPRRSLLADEGGTVLVLFGLAVPVLLAGTSAAVEYASIINRRTALQSAADTAALAAAKELTLANSDSSVIATAKSAAVAKLAMNGPGQAPNVAGRVLDNRNGVEVTIGETIPFMMGNYLGWPKADVSVRAVARLSRGARRLCVVGLEQTGEAIRLEMDAKITAERCEVHADSKFDQAIKAFNNSVLKAERTCTAGGYKASKSSNFAPTPITDCPRIGDPLAGRAPPSVGSCTYTNKVVTSQETLDPGVYCGGLKVGTGGIASLRPGTYVMENGRLELDRYSAIYGENVGFYFRGQTSVLDIDPETFVSLTAPKTGAMAGILFFEDRAASTGRTFRIASNYARKLLGTIYLPRGTLYIGSNKPVADQSAYTVVVARHIRMDAGPDLVLNTNYGGTDIPVPDGVGPNAGTDKISLSE